MKIAILVKPGSRHYYKKYVKMHYFAPPYDPRPYTPGMSPPGCIYGPRPIYPVWKAIGGYMYIALARMSVIVYAAMSVAAYYDGDWRRGTLALLFAMANALMFIF